jgi:type IV pilus assembly protein PilA
MSLSGVDHAATARVLRITHEPISAHRLKGTKTLADEGSGTRILARVLLLLRPGRIAVERSALMQLTHRENEMARLHRERSRGFTLVELMIVVAIIGILASVAIPSFLNYQLTSKRAEAFANLSSLAKAQKAYFAEFNTFVSVNSEPSGALATAPTTIKRPSASVDTAFAVVGWAPEGDVFFDYDTVTNAVPQAATCTCVGPCFTAAAYGNLDGDATLSVLLVAHPDAVGGFCETSLAGNQTPPINAGGRMFDQVARVLAADDF